MGSALNEPDSRYTIEEEEGAHMFKIEGYSLRKGMGVNKFVQSAPFTVGGHDWVIRFYPDGGYEETKDSVMISVRPKKKCTYIRAFCHLGLAVVNQDSVFPCRECFLKQLGVFRKSHGISVHLPRCDVEQSEYIQNDCLTIECVLTVLKEPNVYKTRGCYGIEVPPSDITEHLGKMLETKQGADVTFNVRGETFKAHKIFLAMRSPVFKAEFYGPMKESRMRCVTIEDMQPAVFRALLHFIYTDSLPDFDDLDGDDECEMIRRLLVAADRYALDRLKMMCQSILGEILNIKTVALTLDFADQHNCNELKDLCIEFMASSSAQMEAVMKTEGYANLKRSCPSLLVDMFEKAGRFLKPQMSSSSQAKV